MTFNFNEAEPQRGGFGELIPDGTVAVVIASIRPGQSGPAGWLKMNKDGNALMADFEFTIDGGAYDRRKFWGLYVTEGETEGQGKAAAISRSLMRGMLESAFGIDPADDSPAAQARRQVSGWEAFDGLRFCARLGIEKGGLKEGGPDRYADKNVLREAVTPDNPKYLGAEIGVQTATAARTAPTQGRAVAAKPAGAKPSWAS